MTGRTPSKGGWLASHHSGAIGRDLSPELGSPSGSLVSVGGVDLLAFLASEVGVGHGTTGITRGPSPAAVNELASELPENEVEAIAFL